MNKPIHANATSLECIGAYAMTDEWASFDPGYYEHDAPPHPKYEDFAWDLMMRTIPWGVKQWKRAPTPPPSDSSGFVSDNTSCSSDDILYDSLPGGSTSSRFSAGQVDLLDQQDLSFDPDADFVIPDVQTWPSLHLPVTDSEWLYSISAKGVRLDRPSGAPDVFEATQPSPLMDRVVTAWEQAGFLVPVPALKHAMPMILVPGADGDIQPIIDFSAWSANAPRPTRFTAFKGIRSISRGSYLIRINLKSGFSQLRIDVKNECCIGMFYQGRHLALSRLPVGQDVTPSILQRACTAILEHVAGVTGVGFIIHLDEWLLYASLQDSLLQAINLIVELGVTIDMDKSSLIPNLITSYMGFQINTDECSLLLEDESFHRLCDLLRLVPHGSVRDRERIYSFCSWILWNIRWPLFLASDILTGDASWFNEALEHMDITSSHRFDDAHAKLHLYSDATPHSVAFYIPSCGKGFARAFYRPADINHAELVAALLALHWAAKNYHDTHFILHVDSKAAFLSLLLGNSRLFRRWDIRRLYLSVITFTRMSNNTYGITHIRSTHNQADSLSRQVLRTLRCVR